MIVKIYALLASEYKRDLNNIVFQLIKLFAIIFIACGSSYAQEVSQKVLQRGSWYQFAVPSLTSGQSLRSIAPEALPADRYSLDWILFAWDPVENAYREVSLDEPLLIGEGYWIIQVVEDAVVFELPDNADAPETDQSIGCPSPAGCVEVPYQLGSGDISFNLLGSPYSSSIPVEDFRIAGGRFDDDCFFALCTLDEALLAGAVNNELIVYDADTETYSTLGAGTELPPWQGFWTVAIENADQLQPRLLMPAPSEDTGSDNEPITTEPIESWQLRGTANTVLAVDNVLFVGGDFTEIYNDSGETVARTYLAAFDRSTGRPTSFAPELGDKVWALAVSPDNEILYVGGAFISAEGIPRKRIAAYNIGTGELTNFNTPSPNAALRAIAVYEDTVYLGGLFTQVGGEDRFYVAAFDASTGALNRDFNVSTNNVVNSLVAEAGRLWIGGNFWQINGTRQRGVGAVDTEDGSLLATDEVGYPVIALAATDTQLFIAGAGPGGTAAAFDLITDTEQWEITGAGNFQAVDVDDGRFVYFGGHYESIEGNTDANRLTRHYKTNGSTDTTWHPQINGLRSINAIDVTPTGLHIGGDFTRVDGTQKEGFAVFRGLTE